MEDFGVFPLPQKPLNDLLRQIQSTVPNELKKSERSKTMLRTLQYESEGEAKSMLKIIQNISEFSQSRAINYKVSKSSIKYLPTERSQSQKPFKLIFEVQAITETIKQTLIRRRRSSESFSQKELLQIIYCLNQLSTEEFYFFKSEFLLNQIVLVGEGTFKPAHPLLVCPYDFMKRNMTDTKQFYRKRFTEFIADLFSLGSADRVQRSQQGKVTVRSFKSDFLNYFSRETYVSLSNQLPWVDHQTSVFDNIQISYQKSQNDRAFPVKKGLKKSKISASAEKQQSTLNTSQAPKKYLTLQEMTQDRIAESFQTDYDEISYVIFSNNSESSPSKSISPSKKNSIKRQSPSRLAVRELVNVQIQELDSEQNQSNKESRSFKYEISESEGNCMKQSLESLIESEQQKFEALRSKEFAPVTPKLEPEIVLQKQEYTVNNPVSYPSKESIQSAQSQYYGETNEFCEKHGKGKLIFSDGGYYEGQWLNDHMDGFGKLYYPSGELAYAGYWKESSFWGAGIIFNEEIEFVHQSQAQHLFENLTQIGKKWHSYKGEFKNDFRNGKGLLKLSNQDSIEGFWVDNRLEGEAVITKANGDKIRGVWENSIFQKAS